MSLILQPSLQMVPTYMKPYISICPVNQKRSWFCCQLIKVIGRVLHRCWLRLLMWYASRDLFVTVSCSIVVYWTVLQNTGLFYGSDIFDQ